MDDRARVAELLGRAPQGDFDVVVRDDAGDPVVIRNAPFLTDGTPMPTRYYLVGPALVRAVSRLEADGGVRRAEHDIDPAEIADVHRRYGRERDGAIDAGHTGPRPTGGVGGTRTGVKCLHAHVAHELAGGDDPVGRWALERLGTATAAARRHPTRPDRRVRAMTTLRVTIDDAEVTIRTAATGDHTESFATSFALPVGPLTLLADALTGGDPPPPASLTNALGLVADHLDDVLIEAPEVAGATDVTVFGTHARVVAAVELGHDDVPPDYVLERADADEVFRTVALEPVDDRRHNPGLPEWAVESILGTCCVILGLMRRLELSSVKIQHIEPAAEPTVDPAAESAR